MTEWIKTFFDGGERTRRLSHFVSTLADSCTRTILAWRLRRGMSGWADAEDFGFEALRIEILRYSLPARVVSANRPELIAGNCTQSVNCLRDDKLVASDAS